VTALVILAARLFRPRVFTAKISEIPISNKNNYAIFCDTLSLFGRAMLPRMKVESSSDK